jgi:hypothetical protein
VAAANRDFHAAPLILGGTVYFATQNGAGTTTHLTKHTIDATTGALGAAVTAAANGGAPYFGLVTDGTNLFAATRVASGGAIFVGVDTSFAQLPNWASATVASGLSAEPTIGIDGKLYASDLSSAVAEYSTTTGASTAFATALGGAALTPLQGSDNHIYLPRQTGLLFAYEGNQLSWTFDPPTAILRYATMDCSGRLFAASGNVVYAFISDDHGLADTRWPALRRDARNSGNDGAIRYGSRIGSGAGTCTQ